MLPPALEPLCCLLGSPRFSAPRLQLTKVAPSGGPNHTSVNSCYKVEVQGWALTGSL